MNDSFYITVEGLNQNKPEKSRMKSNIFNDI